MSKVWLLEPSRKNGEVREPSYDREIVDSSQAFAFFDMKSSEWNPPNPWIVEAQIEGNPKAFRLFRGLVVSSEVWSTLKGLLESYVDTFPLSLNGEQFVSIRAQTCYDSRLDIERSAVQRYRSSGRIMRIFSYKFDMTDIADVFHDSSGRYRLFVTGDTSGLIRDALEEAEVDDLCLSDVSVKPPVGRPAW